MECKTLGLVASVLLLVLILLMGYGESARVDEKVEIYESLEEVVAYIELH